MSGYKYNSMLGEIGERSKLQAKGCDSLRDICRLWEAIGGLAGLRARGWEV